LPKRFFTSRQDSAMMLLDVADAEARAAARPSDCVSVLEADVMTGANEQAPRILDLPIGLDATGMRQEFHSLGTVEVPANHYWGAQTQRSLQHFNIGSDRMPKEVYHAYGYVKKAAAVVNTRAGRLPGWKGQLIERVCDEGDLALGASSHVRGDDHADGNSPRYEKTSCSADQSDADSVCLPAPEFRRCGRYDCGTT
jgi:hypothetical protein